MLFAYAPYLATLSINELGKYANMFGLDMRFMNDLLARYKQLYIEDSTELTEDNKYDLSILKQIVNDVLVNKETKTSLQNKYKLSPSTFDKYMEQLKIIDIDAYNQVNNKLKKNLERALYSSFV